MKNTWSPWLLVTLFSWIAPSFATESLSEANQRGLDVAREADRRDAGFKDFTASLEMILRNRQGQESTRLLKNRTLEVDDDGDKLLIVFDQPRDVKGTVFLAYTHKLGADDQWLYLPALKRVKRISSSNKSGPFMGSEFAYEDLTSPEIEKYRYTFKGRDSLHGRDTYVVERIPQDPKSGYTRQVVWYDQATYRIEKIEFYDRKNALLKTLEYEGYQQYLDTYWRPGRMMMRNHQNGKSTELLWRDYAFQVGLSDRDFDRNSMKRAR